jgi:intracellular sulfur oxidation DsrE/DsrF family protein
MKTKLFVLVGALLISGITLAQSGDNAKHKIVIQFNDADSVSQNRVLLQVENIRKVWSAAEIEVVCLSGGLDLLTKKGSKMSQQVAEWTNKGVVFAACNNTMTLRKISKEDLIPQAVVIPAAIIELASKQEAGWSYFRGGK